MTAQIYYCRACSWPITVGVSHRGECQKCHERMHPLERFCVEDAQGAVPHAGRLPDDGEAVRHLRASVTDRDRAARDASSKAATAAAQGDHVEAMRLHLLAALRSITSALACLELSDKESAARRPGLAKCAGSRAKVASTSIASALERETGAVVSLMGAAMRVLDGRATGGGGVAARPRLRVVAAEAEDDALNE